MLLPDGDIALSSSLEEAETLASVREGSIVARRSISSPGLGGRLGAPIDPPPGGIVEVALLAIFDGGGEEVFVDGGEEV